MGMCATAPRAGLGNSGVHPRSRDREDHHVSSVLHAQEGHETSPQSAFKAERGRNFNDCFGIATAISQGQALPHESAPPCQSGPRAAAQRQLRGQRWASRREWLRPGVGERRAARLVLRGAGAGTRRERRAGTPPALLGTQNRCGPSQPGPGREPSVCWIAAGISVGHAVGSVLETRAQSHRCARRASRCKTGPTHGIKLPDYSMTG